MSDAVAVDSRPSTWAHINEVQRRLMQVVVRLQERLLVHDASKLQSPEVEAFDAQEGALAATTYGSDEYRSQLHELGPALEHHYSVNDHHPDHFAGGIAEMDLIQLTEMLADWKAATMRHNDGDLMRSIVQNRDRFKYGPEIQQVLINTAKNLGWL